MYVSLSVCLSCLSGLSVFQFVCPSVRLVCLSDCLSVFLCVCLSGLSYKSGPVCLVCLSGLSVWSVLLPVGMSVCFSVRSVWSISLSVSLFGMFVWSVWYVHLSFYLFGRSFLFYVSSSICPVCLVCLSFYLSVYLFCLFVCLSVFLFVCLSIFLSIILSRLYVSSVCLSVLSL